MTEEMQAGPVQEPDGEDAAGRTAVRGVDRGAGWAGSLRALVRDLAISVMVVMLIVYYLYQPVRVEGTSMMPVLEDQDRLFVNKVAFHVGEVHRGDVVVCKYPRDANTLLIKQVIALPGDTVRIEHGMVLVNGRRVAEPYVPSRYLDDQSEPEMQLGKTEYFVMGDHRSVSLDSRSFGPVDRKLIEGKAAFVYWPMDQAGVVK